MESVMKASSFCRVIGVLVDEKGRISTMLKLMASDLRNLIDHKDLRLSYQDKTLILRAFVSGMKELHGCGFIHKDLKASNVLVSLILFESMCTMKGDMFGMNLTLDKSIFGTPRFHYTNDLEWIDVKIGDYERSDGVVGTWCFKAPKVFRALRDGTNVKYSPVVDVYGFGMLCYKLFIGKLPFQDHPLSEYDLVLLGKRHDISNSNWEWWMRRLLQCC
jgi:serine/threonine protein kinase